MRCCRLQRASNARPVCFYGRRDIHDLASRHADRRAGCSEIRIRNRPPLGRSAKIRRADRAGQDGTVGAEPTNKALDPWPPDVAYVGSRGDVIADDEPRAVVEDAGASAEDFGAAAIPSALEGLLPWRPGSRYA